MVRPAQRTARDWLEELLGRDGEPSSAELEQQAGELLRDQGPKAAADFADAEEAP